LRTIGKPFRWNMASPRLLRRLGRGWTPAVPAHQQDRLLRCAASVLRAGGDSDLVFVGRSLESVYDLLSGALSRTTWYDRVQILQLSLRDLSPAEFPERCPQRAASLAGYFRACLLTPRQIVERPRPVAFVDLVDRGSTFATLSRLLRFWSGGPAAWREVRERLTWVAVLSQTPPDGGAHWHPSRSQGAEEFDPEHVRRCFLNTQLWRYLADQQLKTTASYTPRRWGDASAGRAPKQSWFLCAARGARALYRQGEKSRHRIAALLDEPPLPIAPIAELARELRREARGRRRRPQEM
jgi:hypothetical protein